MVTDDPTGSVLFAPRAPCAPRLAHARSRAGRRVPRRRARSGPAPNPGLFQFTNPYCEKDRKIGKCTTSWILSMTKYTWLTAVAAALLACSTAGSAHAQPVNRTANGQPDTDIRVGVYVNVRQDCTSGPLPSIQLRARQEIVESACCFRTGWDSRMVVAAVCCGDD
jgi:hypothetical protein